LRSRAAATHDPAVIRVRSLDHFVLRVHDLEASLRFYRDLLGIAVEYEDAYRQGTRPFVSLRVGDQLLDLVPDSTYDPSAGSGGFLHFCLTVAGPLAPVVGRLRERGVPLLHDEPITRGGARGEGLSIYAQDPDGYVVELKEH
jgi:catechol 2,3-dioxygenase-like lactoylglutathione lyase family enzyme